MDVDRATQLMGLPSCLVIEILVRLPIKDLLKCRYVCKDWTGLFSDPLFVKLQLARSPICMLHRLPASMVGKMEFGWVADGSDDDENGQSCIKMMEFTSGFMSQDEAINSCNGLVCFWEQTSTYGGSFRLCNPLLGEWVTISLPRRDRFDFSKLAFGFSAENNQYKVLHFFSFRNLDYGAEIYTLGTGGEWRSIEPNPSCTLQMGNFVLFNTFLHGSQHWVNKGVSRHICSFNFDDEKFRTLSLPPKHDDIDDRVELGVLNGCLCASLYDYGRGKSCVIWNMKEYGDEKSWTPMLAIKKILQDDELYLSVNGLKIIAYSYRLKEHDLLFSLNSEEILLCAEPGEFVCFNTKRRKFTRLNVVGPDAEYLHWTLAYNPSFVSLRDVATVEQVIMKDCRLPS